MGETFFWGKRKCHWGREIRMASNKQNWRKHCKNSSNCVWKSLAVRSITEQVNTGRETVRKILTEDLHMRKVCAKIVPKKLTEEQKQRRVTICKDLLERQDDILGRVITGEETWVYQYDPETKRQSAQWKTANSPRPKKFHQSKSRVKTMLLTFFDIRGIVHYEYVPTGQIINHVYYLEILTKLHEKVRRKQPELLPTTHGSCIMTMHLLTQHCLWGSF